MRSAASASAQCQIATAMMMPYRVPFRVASAFLAGIVLHTLLHFAVHSGQLRNDCRHRGNGRYAAGPSLFPQPKKEGHHRLLILFHATPILSMFKCRIQDGGAVPGALTDSPPMLSPSRLLLTLKLLDLSCKCGWMPVAHYEHVKK